MSKNGMASYGKVPQYMSLVHMPTPKQENVITFANLTGGLNTSQLDYMLPENESPDLVNMRWNDGSLGCRPGQIWMSSEARGVGHSAYEATFYDRGFFHAGTKIYCFDPDAAVDDPDVNNVTELCDLSTYAHDSSGEDKGSWLRYGDYLFYKTRGVFIRVAHDPDTDSFTVADMAVEAYAPVIVINAAAENGSGDLYQPENRLSPKKTVWYNAATEDKTVTIQTTTATTYTLADTTTAGITDAFLDGVTFVEGVDWSYDRDSHQFNLLHSVDAGKTLTLWLKIPTAHYYLPVGDPNLTITKITACLTADLVETELTRGLKLATDPVQWTPLWNQQGFEYVYYPNNGHILFRPGGPYVPWPMVNNTVKVTYSLANPEALKSILDCPYGTVFGGQQDMCLVLGGCDAQPNAYFWNGNNAAMDAGYWPIDQYNLAGDTGEPVTGFGKQQNMLVIFSERSIGRATLGTQNLNDRVTLTMDYVRINSRIGCDLPWTIQLIENNLVFCNTDQGIHFIRDTSAAYENNIVGISRKVNGTGVKPGLLSKLRAVDSRESVVSFDDEECYWLVLGSEVYVWDYRISDIKNPSFFYYTAISARGFFRDDQARVYHIDTKGRVTKLATGVCADYGGAIYKKYVFPTQFFSTYDRLKDVTRVIFSVRPITSTRIKITYITDWEERSDLTDVGATTWSLIPRNLATRNLFSTKFANTAIRRPGCRHVRHFQMQLENDEPMRDLGVTFAQIFYKYQGRDR